MKKIFSLLLAVLMVLFMVACSSGIPGAAAQSEAAAPVETEAKEASFYEITEPSKSSGVLSGRQYFVRITEVMAGFNNS